MRPTFLLLGTTCGVLLPWEPLRRHWRSVLLQVTAWRWSRRLVSPARWCWLCFSQLCSSPPSLLQVNVQVLVSRVMSLRYFGLLHLWQIYFHVPGGDKAPPSCCSLWEKDISEQSFYRRPNPSPWCGSWCHLETLGKSTGRAISEPVHFRNTVTQKYCFQRRRGLEMLAWVPPSQEVCRNRSLSCYFLYFCVNGREQHPRACLGIGLLWNSSLKCVFLKSTTLFPSLKVQHLCFLSDVTSLAMIWSYFLTGILLVS